MTTHPATTAADANMAPATAVVVKHGKLVTKLTGVDYPVTTIVSYVQVVNYLHILLFTVLFVAGECQCCGRLHQNSGIASFPNKRHSFSRYKQ